MAKPIVLTVEEWLGALIVAPVVNQAQELFAHLLLIALKHTAIQPLENVFMAATLAYLALMTQIVRQQDVTLMEVVTQMVQGRFVLVSMDVHNTIATLLQKNAYLEVVRLFLARQILIAEQ